MREAPVRQFGDTPILHIQTIKKSPLGGMQVLSEQDARRRIAFL
ncbi:hypothetical protein HY3_12900 [Hyphomonas pacifica]|uniref:Uncharacterized protein n=1 Tax=Hyphomonas pacifica TaxID=1280941 RepID=A0A062TZK3_9PROT|nr:hypothetical protein HY2_13020 [Hyphomonas pacifica]RAN33444.1 hypothetical protein HY3_12900 [Hyphomonas pacifica]RAN36490.1 hypothetical protein HY11_01850 [Hyphomonas pacifica]